MTTPALLVIDVQNAIDDPKWGRRGQPEMERTIGELQSSKVAKEPTLAKVADL